MGLEENYLKPQFGLGDLGVLDGPSLRGMTAVVNAAHAILPVRGAGFLTFDELFTSANVRTSAGAGLPGRSMQLRGSIMSTLRSENRQIAVNSLRKSTPDAPERVFFGAEAMLAAPVYGPGEDPIGALVAYRRTPHFWCPRESHMLVELAYLITQEVMLQASFETLRLIQLERKRSANQPRA